MATARLKPNISQMAGAGRNRRAIYFSGNRNYNGWSRVAISSPEDCICNGVSSHKYRRDKYHPGRSGAMGGRREIRQSAALGTGSEKARRVGGGGGYCVCPLPHAPLHYWPSRPPLRALLPPHMC